MEPPGCPGSPWVPPGCLLGASWVPPGCLLGVSWVLPCLANWEPLFGVARWGHIFIMLYSTLIFCTVMLHKSMVHGPQSTGTRPPPTPLTHHRKNCSQAQYIMTHLRHIFIYVFIPQTDLSVGVLAACLRYGWNECGGPG